jgi:hypothetical protein
MAAKKKTPKKEWPPMHPAGSGPEPEPASGAIMHQSPGSSLVDRLSAMPGMNRGLAERMVNDGNWPADAGELARKYGLMQLDADEIQKVLNRNRGGK